MISSVRLSSVVGHEKQLFLVVVVAFRPKGTQFPFFLQRGEFETA